MKITIFAAIIICLLCTSSFCAPLRSSNGTFGVRGFQYLNDYPNAVSAQQEQSVYHILGTRQEPNMTSVLDVPVIGSFLRPLLPMLESAELAGPAASAVNVGSLTISQLATLSNIQALLSQAVYNLTSGSSNDAQSTTSSSAVAPESTASNTTSTTENTSVGAEGLDLGAILAGIPILGPFLAPLGSLFKLIGLSVPSVASLDEIQSITLQQASTLAQFEYILSQAVDSFESKSNTPTSSSPPSSTTSSP